MSYTVNLPHYSVGADCYQEIPKICGRFGKTAAVVGGRIAMEKARPYLTKALENSDFRILEYVWYGGNSTYENGDRVLSNENVRNADVIFAVGGGRACDTGKYVADQLHKPLFTFPTLGSNCAAVTAISVIYNEDGSFREYYYPDSAEHMFLNTAVVADSPVDYLWAGIGDALSKEYEAVFSSSQDALDAKHSPLIGVQVSHACTNPLMEFGRQALEDCRHHVASNALEQVALDIIVSTGIVSLLVSKAGDYYYNSTLAHCVYYGSTVTKKGEQHLHGEVVSLGVLCLLEYEKNKTELQRCMAFNASLGLPVCFDDVEIEESEFDVMADKFVQTTEWAHVPAGVTREGFLSAMRALNARGRAYKENHKA